MPILPLVLILVVVAALAVAVGAMISERSRRQLVDRAVLPAGAEAATVVLGPAQPERPLSEVLRSFAPSGWVDSEQDRLKLVQAGYDSATAPLTFATIRLVCLIGLPLLISPLLLGASLPIVALLGGWALIAGWALPVWFLKRAAYRRQERIRRSVPDALDLLVVCIEAGVSLDAAILRVAREIQHVHKELSGELIVVNRKTNAGVPRDQALRGLYDRTGVEEIRALVSTMIQSERWGTSIGNVLQVFAETLRRKRRQMVEQKAATAPLKMMFPLILFILPALFAVVMGPAVLAIGKMLKDMGG